jgi:hypothetical protein
MAKSQRMKGANRNRVVLLVASVLLAALLVPEGGAVAGPAAADSKMIAARQHFFGKENVDPSTGAVRSDRVIMSWFSVSNYAAAFNGHVVLMDSWVARGSYSDRVPTNPDELAALKPEYIFIGHGDFDHAADAAEVAAKSGATVVGTKSHCDSVREQAGEKIPCVAVFPADPPAGLRKDLNLIPGVEITAVTHIHSSFESPEQQDGGRLPCPPPWDPTPTAEHPPTFEDFQHLFSHLGDARGGNILYQFRIGKFALAWHDTTGKLKEDAPKGHRDPEDPAPDRCALRFGSGIRTGDELLPEPWSVHRGAESKGLRGQPPRQLHMGPRWRRCRISRAVCEGGAGSHPEGAQTETPLLLRPRRLSQLQTVYVRPQRPHLALTFFSKQGDTSGPVSRIKNVDLKNDCRHES